MLATKEKEILERCRLRDEAWAKEFGFEPPPKDAGWEELKIWEQQHADDIERADVLSEMKRIEARSAAK